MSSSAPARPPSGEHHFLAEMQKRYVDEGFSFVVEPAPEQLPPFLGSYKPDAIAQKPGYNIAIEVMERSSRQGERPLTEIRRLFDGRQDWKLVVAHLGTDPSRSLTIPASALASISFRLEEVKGLLAAGQHRAAFVMAWSLLEAVLRRVASGHAQHPLNPGTVVQTLAMLGHIDPEVERRARSLIEPRNRIVHGDLETHPSPEDVKVILSAVEQTLANEEI